MYRFSLIVISFIHCYLFSAAQPGRWQQRVKYTMNIDMNVFTNQFTGTQKLEYTNHSPDELNRVFYHLYFNAFQPNSSMDVRSRELGKSIINGKLDWDRRVQDRISKLTGDEIGYQKIISLKMNGASQPFKYHETILEVNLTQAIASGSKVVFDMEFEAQVPLQIRRSGRDNPVTGVRYSMSQWYPKLCEYDEEGWHPTPYVGREFYGVWGDFDVSISIDKNYKLGGTGTLVNPGETGWGYDSPGTGLKQTAKAKRTWHFVGNNVHDFVWAADPDYKHVSRKIRSGLTIHVLYKSNREDAAKWEGLLDMAQNAFPYIEKTFGAYPYPQYSFITGGDGGMEYPMATLLAEVPGAMHELMHSWYQGMLGTNESEYAWMDEGFAQYAGKRVYADLGNTPGFAQEVHYNKYYDLVKSGLEEPLTTHADHFNSNYASADAAYFKGCVFIEQLGYVTGAAARDKILLEYYKQWRFKHPNPNDFIKLSEDVSGIKLDWYKAYWCNTVKTIDYGIDSLWEEGGVSKIRLVRNGKMPMPVDLQLTFKDGSTETHYIPLNLMYGSKPAENAGEKREAHEAWKWTHPTYTVEFKRRLTDLKRAEIDPTKRMADVDQRNNLLQLNW
ncbi:MAG: M1 family metallopeptidase [Ferruginibacter sp.]|nr:M1 family metallopeptidase [Ferruginibacter sp.]